MSLRKLKGVTLLEIILVLAVGGTITVMGIRMYQSLHETEQAQELKNNVNQLMQALSNYYRANCATGTISPYPPNFLSPYPVTTSGMTYPPGASYPVDISTLLAEGYLSNWYPENDLVSAVVGDSGYRVQLNPKVMTAISVNSCVVIHKGTKCTPVPTVKVPPVSSIPAGQAQIVYWQLQVAVKIKDPAKSEAYLAALGADCISGEGAGTGAVDPCPANNAAKNYLVWNRSPSFTTIQEGSVFSTTMPLLKQLNRQYTQDPNYAFNSGYSVSTSPAQAPVYYLCGG